MKAVKEEIQNLEVSTFWQTHLLKTCNIRISFMWFPKVGREFLQSWKGFLQSWKEFLQIMSNPVFFFKSFPALRPKNSALGKMTFMLPRKTRRASDAATKGSGADALGFWWCQQFRKGCFFFKTKPPSRVSEEVLGFENYHKSTSPKNEHVCWTGTNIKKGKDCLPVPSFFEYPLRLLFDEKDWGRQQSSTVFLHANHVWVNWPWVGPWFWSAKDVFLGVYKLV